MFWLQRFMLQVRLTTSKVSLGSRVCNQHVRLWHMMNLEAPCLCYFRCWTLFKANPFGCAKM